MTARIGTMPLCRSARVAVLAIALLAGLGAEARSQRAGGSIGVSLTILQPLSTQPVQVVGFDVDRNGLATLQTTSPATAPVSQIVMASVERESPTGAVTRQDGAPTTTMVASPALRYVVDLGAPRAVAARETVQLRLRYLTVAGT